ncbi:hypothetical protein COCON_G00046160 [Conger conger]|uniref:Uncharacterized protein n=1 Tax=Conger conger TaxID=82655 RepID=A0A9Q1DUK9_CONCO|nr:hypothetical protein COCON_G00046160 [Conger conger]
MTNAQSWKAADYSDFNASSAFQHQPSSPLKLLSMVCCPNVAQDYGHELLHLPARCAYLSPLASAWWTVKWFISNNRSLRPSQGRREVFLPAAEDLKSLAPCPF